MKIRTATYTHSYTLNSSTHNHPKKHTEKQKKSKEKRKRRTYTERYIQSKHFIIIRWKTFSLKKIKLSLFFASLSFDINRRYLPTVMVAFAFQISNDYYDTYWKKNFFFLFEQREKVKFIIQTSFKVVLIFECAAIMCRIQMIWVISGLLLFFCCFLFVFVQLSWWMMFQRQPTIATIVAICYITVIILHIIVFRYINVCQFCTLKLRSVSFHS